MNADERAFIEKGFKGLSDKIDSHKEYLNKMIEEKDRSSCEKINKLEANFTQHDKRINKLEISVGQLVTKIALFSTIGGLVASIVASIVWGG